MFKRFKEAKKKLTIAKKLQKEAEKKAAATAARAAEEAAEKIALDPMEVETNDASTEDSAETSGTQKSRRGRKKSNTVKPTVVSEVVKKKEGSETCPENNTRGT